MGLKDCSDEQLAFIGYAGLLIGMLGAAALAISILRLL